MDYTCRTKTLQSLAKAMEKETILLSHKLQRPEGQWNRKVKTDLIDSLLRKYPINPTYGIKEDGVISIIDGVQRLSTIRDYLSDKFSLGKDMEPVVINGEEKLLAGLKFSKLDDDTKDILLSSELQIYELSGCTEKDVREMFRRQNSGKPLNGKQLRVIHQSDLLSEIIYSLSTHPFMNKVSTNSQRKSATDRDVIIQTLMLIETNNENDFTSFRSKDMNDFVEWYSNNINNEKITLLNESMNKLDENFSEIKIKVSTTPFILFSAYRVIKDKKSFGKLVNTINEFLNNYDTNAEYKNLLQSATSSQESVRGRLDYWRNIIRTI